MTEKNLIKEQDKASRAIVDDPLVPYCMWKLRRSTLDGLKAEAEERGATVAGLVRKVLGDWVKAKQKKGRRQF